MRVRRHTVVFCLLIFPSPGMLRAKTLRSRLDSERFFGNWIGMFRNSGVILVGSLWIALSSLVYGSEATADQHTARAVQLVKEGKDKEALEEFTKAIETDPKLYLSRAQIYAAGAKWQEAIADYSKVLEIEAKNVEALTGRANAYIHANDHAKALDDLTALLAIKPNDLDALLRRGDLFREDGQIDKAIADYCAVIQAKPDEAAAYAGKGYAEMKKNDKEAALADFNKAS